MKESKICIIGNYSGKLDEGMGNVAFNLFESLHGEFEGLILLNVNNIFKIHFWRKLISFKPDIIHFIPGPTMKTLFFIKFCKMLTNCKTVVTATRPVLPENFKRFANFLKPDILIAQSNTDLEFFENLNYNVKFIPNGVNTEKFQPVDKQKKTELRQKFGFKEEDFIVLHIGPVNKARNQASLLEIREGKILLVASITNESDKNEMNFLKKQGVIIWQKYFKDVQEIYQISDVYIFPGFKEKNSIQIPLSILEAMACNIPVISTRFGGLERIFKESEGFFFMDDVDKINEIITKIKETKSFGVRKGVQHLSWKNISEETRTVYQSLIE